ncbi:D-alanine--poly(phosphoribitol) ligase subunit DltC [Loigolactobacillus coryniformis]|jgi:D-alanine--poly(phosphoribitol) ligase subunit 2|uniref:D-alanine--poly(phosphoribitol) ligase subunit DltC n=1 Tax=Loigolactobacillus coryniformis TaxID=1610 RepID=UPI0002E74B54|nr:D-alanine--poly(phosphoribitol) ligase subunit DltC [Loigolactobacillus coryniformis]MDC4185320.1 D-alanine--poly(phosphoribitol) ligase subunit DltC [Loigolactobacillus coryniformis]MDN5952159.1 D-alanine--poly(phosphoribitol) ligase subunit DltC [Loigolactobacillus coryniformis]MDN5952650.1 D-alanine--poly(phosphoribitol) ligase subunit DltC [Loigolactobacillus coryniformis]
MSIKETVLSILADLTGTDFTQNLDDDLFADDLLDSMGTVQLLLELQDQLGVTVPVSEFDRTQWNTPNKIITQTEKLS